VPMTRLRRVRLVRKDIDIQKLPTLGFYALKTPRTSCRSVVGEDGPVPGPIFGPTDPWPRNATAKMLSRADAGIVQRQISQRFRANCRTGEVP